MSMCFRYRVRMATAVDVPEGDNALLSISGYPTITVSKSQNVSGSAQWVNFKCCGFATEQEAESAGQGFGDALLATGAVHKLGIDIGHSHSTLQFSSEIHDAVYRETGRELRSDVHGLMTFAEGTVKIATLDAHAFATISTDAFREYLARWYRSEQSFSERHRNCAALINDSFFVPNTEGQFILRISAVEALCDEKEVGEELKTMVEKLEQHVHGLTMTDTTRQTIINRIGELKRKSLRQSYLEKFRTLLSHDDASDYDHLYNLRSQLVHKGNGRGMLREANSRALDLAVALYKAEISANTM